MTLAFAIAKGFAVIGILTTLAFVLLPDATVLDSTPLTIPSVIWDPLVGVLHLNRYFPLSALLVVTGLGLAIRAGMAGLWLVSWITRHVF